LRIAESCIKLDDHFLSYMMNNYNDAMNSSSDNQQQEHPLFMLDNFYEYKGLIDTLTMRENSHLISPVHRESEKMSSEHRLTNALREIAT